MTTNDLQIDLDRVVGTQAQLAAEISHNYSQRTNNRINTLANFAGVKTFNQAPDIHLPNIAALNEEEANARVEVLKSLGVAEEDAIAEIVKAKLLY